MAHWSPSLFALQVLLEGACAFGRLPGGWIISPRLFRRTSGPSHRPVPLEIEGLLGQRDRALEVAHGDQRAEAGERGGHALPVLKSPVERQPLFVQLLGLS